jgi:hypothetical protein
VPEFVLTVKSPVPFVVRTASALLSPILTVSASILTSPVPFGAIVNEIFVSDPDVAIEGALPVAAFAIVNSFTAEAVAVNFISSLPLVSLICGIITPPVPLGVSLRSIFVSDPDVAIEGALPVAAFAIVNSFTADAVAVNIISSLPLVSRIFSIIGFTDDNSTSTIFVPSE